jgi:tripartite-type tricarboxylate transporter receptor subunit TctC
LQSSVHRRFLVSPGEFGQFVADETDKWAKVIKAANIKPE